MSFLDFGLRLAGLPDQAIADLDAALPGMARLAARARELQPILEKAKPHLDALEPLLHQAMPILQKAYPDLLAVMPTVEKLVEWAAAMEKPA